MVSFQDMVAAAQRVGRCRKNRRTAGSGDRREGDEGHTKGGEGAQEAEEDVYRAEAAAGGRYRARLVAMLLTSECPRSPSMLRCSR